MKTNHMVSKRCCRKVCVLMSVFLMTFILLSFGYGGQALAVDDYTEPASPWEILSCKPVAACFLSLLMKVIPEKVAEDKPVGVKIPIEWEQGPDEPPDPPDERPNIILILADDMGFNDVSFYAKQVGGTGTPTFPTPNIDSIAEQGVVFNNGYAGNATCAPSRAAIMTGRYGTRFGFEFTPMFKTGYTIIDLMAQCSEDYYKHFLDSDLLEDLGEFGELGMPETETTIAEKLKEADYHTVHIGKWHLGAENNMRPEDQGFDESLLMAGTFYLPEESPDVVNAYLTYSSIDMMVWTNSQYAAQFNRDPSPDGKGGDRFAPDGYLTDYYTDEAIKVIEANKNRPFFLYLAHWGIHTPLQALQADYYHEDLAHITDHRLRVYAAMIRALDRSVGRILEALETRGLTNNTLVIFTSDNGGAPYLGLENINKPYRGWKITFFEGGTHVPFFMKWPKVIKDEVEPIEQISYDSPVAHIDIFATAAAAAGVPVPEVPGPGDPVIDGVDLMPFVTGADSGIPHETLFWRSGYYQVVLDRDSGTGDFWKMQVSGTPPDDDPKQVWLHNLTDDPTEQFNLAESNTTKVADLQLLLDAHNAVQVPSMWDSVLAAPIAIDKPQQEALHEGDEHIYWQN